MNDAFRAFVAVEIGDAALDLLTDWLSREAPRFPGFRFVSRENLHITLQFLGDVDRARTGPLTDTLRSSVEGFPEFCLGLGEAGSFPERGFPRILHVSVDKGRDELVGLAGRVRAALASQGFRPDRPFVPHITLGRARERGGRAHAAGQSTAASFRESFRNFLSSRGDVSVSWRVSRVLLMESILGRGGPTYIVRGAADLASSAP